MMAVGRLTTNITKEPKIIGLFVFSEKLYINGIEYTAYSDFRSIGGCSVGNCTDTSLNNRSTINVTNFTRVFEGAYTNSYMIECRTNTNINVSLVEKQSGFNSTRVMQDDACMPVNLNIYGSLRISTS